MSTEFSFRTRQEAIKRFKKEEFDLLVIGGGITGAATARDAASRGLKVALVEKRDFAWGTSSRSSKLIHGGLRYLQNMEMGLVFEALSERAHLLKTVPHMVRPLPFYLPVYRGDSNGRFILSVGLWMYDMLALFRTPGVHTYFSARKILKEIPFLRSQGLKGGFRFFDASMWDDALAVETVRSASALGAAVANYVEAVEPIWKGKRIVGFRVADRSCEGGKAGADNPTFALRAKKVVVCAGPWTDQVGEKLSPQWKRWLSPSKGVHLVFDLKRIPLPGVLVMSHPEDGRIAFVIPRPDMGAGVVIVGTTDGPSPLDPEKVTVDAADVDYLLELLKRYFPDLKLGRRDILSAYVGVRPLMGTQAPTTGSEGQVASRETAESLQKVSREHYIGMGPGGTVLVAGGKYTTHRTMAQEIVDSVLNLWKSETAGLAKEAEAGVVSPDGDAEAIPPVPSGIGPSRTAEPVNPAATEGAIRACREEIARLGLEVPPELLDRYGAEALTIFRAAVTAGRGRKTAPARRKNPKPSHGSASADPEGFPLLADQLRHGIRTGMVVRLEDFYLRRVPLYASRKDHGLPWAEELAKVWGEELGVDAAGQRLELQALKAELASRSSWR